MEGQLSLDDLLKFMKLIQVPFLPEDNDILGFNLRDVQQEAFDLRRKNVHAADDQQQSEDRPHRRQRVDLAEPHRKDGGHGHVEGV